MNTQLDKFNIDDDSLKGVLNFLPYPFLVSELQKTKRATIFVNQKFLDEIGYSCNNIPTYEDWFKVAYPDPVYRQQIKDEWVIRTQQAQKNNEDSVFLRALIHTKRNGARWYEVKSSVSGGIYLVAFVDIHDVMANEEELKRANKNKDKVLSVLGHDLRSPLKNLHALSSLILESDMTKEEFTDVVKSVNAKSFQTLEFLDTTLLWTKSNFDKISINIEKIFPKAIIEKILPVYRGQYESKKITVTLDVISNMYIHSDAEILTIVIRNLISNAIKFTNENGTIKISTEQIDNFFYFIVNDSGIGMDKGTLGKIAENHYTSLNGTQQEIGLGLGLRLCKELLAHVNGILEMESKPGKGTTVKIKLKNNIEDY